MLSRTSLRRRASRLESGSSIRNSRGLRTIARAIATRWRWPPESFAGLRSSSASSCSICATLSTRGCQLLFSSLRTFMPKVMLSRTDRWGNRA